MSKKGETAVFIPSELDYNFSRNTFQISICDFSRNLQLIIFSLKKPLIFLWNSYPMLIWAQPQHSLLQSYDSEALLVLSTHKLWTVPPLSRKDPLQSWIFQQIDFDSGWVSVKGCYVPTFFKALHYLHWTAAVKHIISYMAALT